LDIKSGNFIQEFWRDINKTPLHINKQELIAAINTIKSLSRGGNSILVSRQSGHNYYLVKGGDKKPFQRTASTTLSKSPEVY
jgi:hypothetical protein